MNEILFYVEEELEGGFSAKSANYSIFTQGDDLETLKENISDAVRCHFEENNLPKVIRLHFVRQEIYELA